MIAKEKWFRKLVINVDSSVVVDVLRSNILCNARYEVLVHRCKSLIGSIVWEVMVSHCYQGANQVADTLINICVDLTCDFIFFTRPPRVVSISLYAHIVGSRDQVVEVGCKSIKVCFQGLRPLSAPKKNPSYSKPLKSVKEVVQEDVHENLSDNSKVISQSLDNANNRPIYVGKFPSQAPNCRSSMEDDEEIDSCLRLFNDRSKIELQLINFMIKVKDVNFLIRVRREATRIQS